MANESVEYVDEVADVGPLCLPSCVVKLPVLECSLLSAVELTGTPPWDWETGLPLHSWTPSWAGPTLLPVGVAILSCGGIGRGSASG